MRLKGKQFAGDLLDFVAGEFRSRIQAGPLTADRQVALPNKSGVLAVGADLADSAPRAFSAAVPFDKPIVQFATHTISAAITFTIAAEAKINGGVTRYRLIADGINNPNFSAFKETANSNGWDGRNGILNLIEMAYDGADYWVTITQQLGGLPTLQNIALTFPVATNRTANITQSGANWGVTGTGTGTWTGQMIAIQSAPAGKTAVLTVEVDDLIVAGFNDSAALQAFTNFEFHAWASGGNLFSNTNGGTIVNHGPIIATNLWLRFSRNGSTGVVTLESSTNAGTSWNAVRTFGTANPGTLYPAFDLSDNATTRQLRIISFEVAP
jgi:hypothetical protein